MSRRHPRTWAEQVNARDRRRRGQLRESRKNWDEQYVAHKGIMTLVIIAVVAGFLIYSGII